MTRACTCLGLNLRQIDAQYFRLYLPLLQVLRCQRRRDFGVQSEIERSITLCRVDRHSRCSSWRRSRSCQWLTPRCQALYTLNLAVHKGVFKADQPLAATPSGGLFRPPIRRTHPAMEEIALASKAPSSARLLVLLPSLSASLRLAQAAICRQRLTIQ